MDNNFTEMVYLEKTVIFSWLPSCVEGNQKVDAAATINSVFQLNIL
jgi:hypothetical protein